MADLQGRKVFKVFNQDFIVDERYTVTKELGQGAYGIVWYVSCDQVDRAELTSFLQCGNQRSNPRRCCDQEGHQCLLQEDSSKTRTARDQASPAFQRSSQREYTTPGVQGMRKLTLPDHLSLRYGYSSTRQLQRDVPIRG